MPRVTIRGRAVGALLCIGLVAAACSGGSPDDGSAAPAASDGGAPGAGSTTTAPGGEAAPASVEPFEGSEDDFYVVPDPLPPGDPGDLIRVMPIELDDPGMEAMRIMYRSVDGAGRDRAVTGTVRYPVDGAPGEGWPVVSWAHGTTGLASQCAPSRFEALSPGFGIDAVYVSTDYVGLGPVGERHPYLSRASEGNSVIDAVRAVRQIPEAHAGARWFSIGHSQGGHGAQAAHELAAERAPELELLGTVSFAPAAMFENAYDGVDVFVSRIVGIMALYGLATEVDGLDPDDYVTPEVARAESVLDDGCLDEIIGAYLEFGLEPLYDTDPMTTEPASDTLVENDVGHVAAEAPLLLVSGTADDRVVIDRVLDLEERLCATGQVTELIVVDGANHGDIVDRTATEVTAWLEARLAGEPATDTCGAS